MKPITLFTKACVVIWLSAIKSSDTEKDEMREHFPYRCQNIQRPTTYFAFTCICLYLAKAYLTRWWSMVADDLS